jgi:hypothetical protein
MRLSEDRIKQGLLHADRDVRDACLSYFADCFSPDRTVMATAIEALLRFGRNKTFFHLYPLAHLAQSEETIRWVLAELKDRPRHTEQERHYLAILSQLLAEADPTLRLPHE